MKKIAKLFEVLSRIICICFYPLSKNAIIINSFDDVECGASKLIQNILE